MILFKITPLSWVRGITLNGLGIVFIIGVMLPPPLLGDI